MEIYLADEEQNKKWVSIVKEWVDREKADAFTILFSEECSLLVDFRKHEETLVEYLISLDGWLTKYGIKKALKEMPSVGMLLSQLCKVPLALTSAALSKALISCILHLSDILHHTNDEDTSSKRAKKWAVDHFSTMIGVDGDSVDMFLLEEFGISHEEYFKEHMHQSSLQLLELLQHKLTLNDLASLNTVFEFLKMVDNQQLAPAFEAIVCADCSNGQVGREDSCLSDSQLIWISERKRITISFSTNSLHVLFKRSIASFENYIICIVEEIIDAYPGLHRGTMERYINDARLFPLCSLDARYYLGVIQIIKDTFAVVGVHHGLVQFLRSFIRRCKQLKCIGNIGQHSVDTFQRCIPLGKLLTKEACGLNMEQREDNLRRIDGILANYISENEEGDDARSDFEIWFKLVQCADWIDEAILLLFDGCRQNVAIYIRLLFRFLYPTEYREMVSYLQPLTSYVFALRNLQQKNHIQLSDLEFLLSSLMRKLPSGDLHCITAISTVLNVIFLAKSYGGDPIADQYLEHMLHVGDDHTIYWFLYTIQLLLKQTNSIKPIFKDTLTKRLSKLQFIQENNGDKLEQSGFIQRDSGDIAGGRSKSENICLACCEIKKCLS